MHACPLLFLCLNVYFVSVFKCIFCFCVLMCILFLCFNVYFISVFKCIFCFCVWMYILFLCLNVYFVSVFKCIFCFCILMYILFLCLNVYLFLCLKVRHFCTHVKIPDYPCKNKGTWMNGPDEQWLQKPSQEFQRLLWRLGWCSFGNIWAPVFTLLHISWMEW